MEYPSYTNDSDAQFAAELDKFKLGPGIRPGSTAKSASEAAMDSMGNNYKNVAALMQARASLGASSMATRKSISDDQMAKKTYDELDEFSRMVRDEYDPNDPEKNAQTAAKGASMFFHNRDVLEAASNMNQAASGVFKAKQDASFSRDIDFLEAERFQREELARLETRNAFSKIEKSERLYKEGEMGDENKKIEAWASMIYGIKDLNTPETDEVADALTSAWTKLSFDGDMETRNEFNYLAESYSKASFYDSVNSDEIAFAKNTKNKLKYGAEIDLDAAKTPEEKATALAKANEWITSQYPTKTSNEKTNEKNRRSIAQYQEGLDKDAKITGTYSKRAAIAQAIKQLSDSVPSKDAPDDQKRDYKVNLAKLKLNLSGFNSEINSIYEAKKQRMGQDERFMDLRKKALSNDKLAQDIRLDAQNPEFKQLALDARRQGLDQQRSLAIFKAILSVKQDKMMSNKTDEEILSIIQTALDASGFEDGGLDLPDA
jgi:hypothetical protein